MYFVQYFFLLINNLIELNVHFQITVALFLSNQNKPDIYSYQNLEPNPNHVWNYSENLGNMMWTVVDQVTPSVWSGHEMFSNTWSDNAGRCDSVSAAQVQQNRPFRYCNSAVCPKVNLF